MCHITVIGCRWQRRVPPFQLCSLPWPADCAARMRAVWGRGDITEPPRLGAVWECEGPAHRGRHRPTCRCRAIVGAHGFACWAVVAGMGRVVFAVSVPESRSQPYKSRAAGTSTCITVT